MSPTSSLVFDGAISVFIWTRGSGAIKERELNSLISGREFPDKPLIIPCSI
jgi:hypothetical protein